MREFLKEKLHPKLLVILLAWKNYFFGEKELKILHRFVDKKKSAIDVGANRGIYTYFLSRIAKDVIAFEPNPDLVKFLEKANFENVKIEQVALSDSKNEKNLNFPLREGKPIDGWASINAPLNEKNMQFNKIKVKCEMLDEYNFKNVGFIKIDVEGHEDSLLEGGKKFIRENSPNILIEIEQRHITKPINEIFNKIITYGYKGFFLDGKILRPLKEFSVKRNQLDLINKCNNDTKANYINNFLFIPEVAKV